jgi:hypothetical protein
MDMKKIAVDNYYVFSSATNDFVLRGSCVYGHDMQLHEEPGGLFYDPLGKLQLTRRVRIIRTYRIRQEFFED